MQKNNRSPAPHPVNPGRLPLATDPQTAPPLQEGTQSFVEADAAANTVGLDRKKPCEPAPPLADTAYLETQKGMGGGPGGWASQTAKVFAIRREPRTPKRRRSLSPRGARPTSLRPSLLLCSSFTNTRGGRPNWRKRSAPRLPTSLTRARCRLPLTPNRTAPAAGHPVVRGG